MCYTARAGLAKTTLLRAVIEPHQADTLYLDCDDPAARDALTRRRKSDLRALVGGRALLVTTRRNAPPVLPPRSKPGRAFSRNPGGGGRSSLLFDISRNVNEPLTAGKLRFYLYPLSMQELLLHYSAEEMKAQLGSALCSACTRRSLSIPTPRGAAKNPARESLPRRDRAPAGEEPRPPVAPAASAGAARGRRGVVHELGGELGVDKSTAARYVSLLEQAHLVFQIAPFNRKLGKELGKLRKIYFYDVGLRNAVIRSFNPLELRSDVEALWENYFISERFKFNRNRRRYDSSYSGAPTTAPAWTI